MQSSTAVLALLALLVLGTGPVPSSLTPQPVEISTKEPRDGAQLVHADAQGRAVLLDLATLELRKFRNGRFTDPEALQESPLTGGVVRRAARSRDGDAWLLYAPPVLRYLKDGREIPLPRSNWSLESIGFHGDQPVLSARPILTGRERTVGFRASEAPPLIQTLSGDRWQPLLDREKSTGSQAPMARHLDSGMLFATDHRGNLWAAHHYRYRIYKLSPSGRLLETLEVAGGKLPEASITEDQRMAAVEEVLSQAKKEGLATQGMVTMAITSNPAINGIVEGRDGRLYLFLGHGASGLDTPVLDRYDPTRNVLERMPLRLDYQGFVSMAAAREGLLLAGYGTRTGVWILDWETLEASAWTPIAGGTLNGLPLVPPAPPQPPARPTQ
jgi:hypothetical protein